MTDIDKQVNALLTNPNFLKLSAFRDRPNLFETLAASHTEMWHSAFVKWVLDPGSHLGLGDFPLKRFLFAVLEFGALDVNVQRPDLTVGEVEDMDLASMSFETEWGDEKLRTSKGGKARIDVYGVSQEVSLLSREDESTQLRLIIENKIGAKESNDQTNTYYSWAQGSTSNFRYDLFVFLVAKESQTPACDRFIRLTYQDLCDAVLVPCLNHPSLPEESRYLLEQYLINLGRPSKKGLVMAEPNRELCKRIYEAHKEVLDEIFESVKGGAPSRNTKGSKIHQSSISLSDLVRAKLVDVSVPLQATYQGNSHTATLQQEPSGGVAILVNGARYEAPSSAANAVTNKSVNGWTFWKVGDGRTLDEVRKLFESKQAGVDDDLDE